jgi:hypothetical protein
MLFNFSLSAKGQAVVQIMQVRAKRYSLEMDILVKFLHYCRHKGYS